MPETAWKTTLEAGGGGRESRVPRRTVPTASLCLFLCSCLPAPAPLHFVSAVFSSFPPLPLCLAPDRMLVHSVQTPEFVCWKFILGGLVFGCGVFRKWLGHKSGALMKRDSALIKEDPELPLTWGCSVKLAGYTSSELRTSPDTRSARASRLDFLTSRTVLLEDFCCSLSGVTPASLLLLNSHFSFHGFLFLLSFSILLPFSCPSSPFSVHTWD